MGLSAEDVYRMSDRAKAQILAKIEENKVRERIPKREKSTQKREAVLWSCTIYGDPRTKKNSSRVIQKNGRTIVLPSKPYTEYEKSWKGQVMPPPAPIDYAVNMKAVYYMKTRRKVDLANLEEATLDILVKYGVLADDNCTIVATMDGSRVEYDKENPRVEITLTEK